MYGTASASTCKMRDLQRHHFPAITRGHFVQEIAKL